MEDALARLMAIRGAEDAHAIGRTSPEVTEVLRAAAKVNLLGLPLSAASHPVGAGDPPAIVEEIKSLVRAVDQDGLPLLEV